MTPSGPPPTSAPTASTPSTSSTPRADPLAEVVAHPRRAALLPLSAVRLTAGPLRAAQDRDLAYVLRLDVDRLLAPYRREAGLTAVTEGYGNWEGDGMGGHIGGHYLSAASLLVASTGDREVSDRVDQLLDGLQLCHDARSDGFLGGVPDGAALAGELAGGRIEADLFSLNGRWVPLYNLHKTLSGLLDAVVHAGRGRALPLAVDLAQWWMRASRHLSAEDFERVLHTEPGGMTEAFTTLSALTGDDRYLVEARRFAHRELLEPLLQGRDALDGLHANTQIPKAVGYEALGQVSGDEDLLEAASAFWAHVVHERTVAIGGNSVREHFHARDDFTSVVTDRQGPEGCNTVNMVELSVLQYLREPRPALVDFVERALFNHVLASQHPEHGGLVYFTPMRPGHYRVYSQPETSMWCCAGSGMEAHARHGAFVAVRGASATGEATLDVLLHVDAEVADDEGGTVVRMRRADPQRLGPGRVVVEVEPLAASSPATSPVVGSPGTATTGVVRLRRPGWSPDARAEVTGGAGVLVEDDADWFTLRVPRDAAAGAGVTTVVLDLPAQVHVEQLPDGSAWSAFLHGPVVLAAAGGNRATTGLLAGPERMGHVAAGPLVPLAEAAVVPDTSAVRRLPDGRLVLDVSEPSSEGERPGERELVPLSGVHDQRYTVYWPTGEPRARRVQLRALDAALAGEDVVDHVAGGEQQPESDHHLRGGATSAEREGTVHWRWSSDWFSYELRDPDGLARRLRVTSRDPVDPGDTVLVDGAAPAEVAVDAAPGGCVQRTYALPDPAGRTSRTVVFRAAAGSRTRAVVAVDLLR